MKTNTLFMSGEGIYSYKGMEGAFGSMDYPWVLYYLKKASKRKAAAAAEQLPLRIYHKNKGRSKRIFNQQMKKSRFGPMGKGQPQIKHSL
ncbi:hypothetical protein Tco_1148669 [Tanacetum coccineum]